MGEKRHRSESEASSNSSGTRTSEESVEKTTKKLKSSVVAKENLPKEVKSENRSHGEYSRRRSDDDKNNDRSWRYQHENRHRRRSRSPSPRRRSPDGRDYDRRRRGRSNSRDERSERRYNEKSEEDKETEEWLTKKRKVEDLVTTRAGGAYIPPAKLKLMQSKIDDKSSEQYQRLSWELLKKRIHGQVNKINVGNIAPTVTELLKENVVRGKGLLARSIIQAQAFSPTFSHVYAALVSIINSKFPHIGKLVLCRLIVQFKRAFRRNDKNVSITCTKFIAHLVNQQVVHEILALEILTLLMENPTDDSIEIAIAFLKECGSKLTELTPRGISAIFDRLRNILNEAEIDARTKYMIEVVFQVRKDKFAAHPSVITELDLVEEEDQITHTVMLDDAQDPENALNVFHIDPEFTKNEEIYEEIKREIIGDGSEDGSDGDEEDDGENEGEPSGEVKGQTTIIDNTEANLVAFRRTVYLTIQSSLDYQEAIHKLWKMEIKPGMEIELCNMVLDCCAQQRTYERFYGLMAERLCRLKKEYQTLFEGIFRDTYDTIHRFEITKLRNVTKFFAHLLYTDAITWEVLGHIKLNEDETTSAGRIMIKVLFQELVEFMGLDKIYERIQDNTIQKAFDGIFPRDNPRDSRFSINFFTSIGLGGLTVDLREHLKKGDATEVVSLPQC